MQALSGSLAIDNPRQFGPEDPDGGEQLERLYPIRARVSTRSARPTADGGETWVTVSMQFVAAMSLALRVSGTA